MELLKRIANTIDTISEYVGRAISWVALALVVLVFVCVVLRYAFKTSFVWMQELQWWFFSYVFLIGAGYTLLHDAHVRVDIIYQRLGFKGKAWINLIGTVVFLIPGCLLVILTSWNFVLSSYRVMEGSLDPGGLPYMFLVKAAIPVGFVLLLMQGLSLGLHSFLQVTGHEIPPKER
jgi:TRAP-type mannitol/chloroaromatic compound transport system permease small subunit